MEDIDKTCAEIQLLCTLVGMTTDGEALAEIDTMIRELERRVHPTGNGAAAWGRSGRGLRHTVRRPTTSPSEPT
jgi:hypothetical protein